MPADYVYKKKDGNTIDCYGKIHEDSNFAVVCENELYDGIAARHRWRQIQHLEKSLRLLGH